MHQNSTRRPRSSFGYAILLLLALLAIPLSAAAQTVLWSDEFNAGTAPNPSVWSYDLGAGGWGNSELQEYTSNSSNVRVEGGQLIITAQQVLSKGGRRTFTSARIKSDSKLTFQYGTIEARIKAPNLANGLWPAFWTLGSNFSTVGWPNSGEFDIMEMGSAAAISAGLVNRRVGSAAHWENNGGTADYGLSYDSPTDLTTDFHLLRMEWTPTLVSTYIDNNLIWAIDISPTSCTDCTEFHQPHFMIFNLAVGGTYTGITQASGITAPIPAEMRVDWVRVSDNGYTILGGSAIGSSGTKMHVNSITPGSTGAGTKRKATASVVILDETGAAVSGAAVTGTFSGSHNQTVTAQTDANGVANLATTVTSSTVAFTVCVGNVVKTGLTYDPAANVETCDVK
jgi:beta-glucanase (GH16 family)